MRLTVTTGCHRLEIASLGVSIGQVAVRRFTDSTDFEETAMRFMILRKADADTEAGAPGSTELFAAMGAYHEEFAKAGVLLAGEGLKPSTLGVRVGLHADGTQTVIDGPFTESKELIAGFTMIQAKSLEEAVEWSKRWPALDASGNVRLEIRQVFDAEDFENATPELIAKEAELRARSAAAQG
jgi:hypothetical protein